MTHILWEWKKALYKVVWEQFFELLNRIEDGDLREKYDLQIEQAPLKSDAGHVIIMKNLMCGYISLDCAASLYDSWYLGHDKWNCIYECWGQLSDFGRGYRYGKWDLGQIEAN